MSTCLGIRGATTAEENSPVSIVSATKELLQELVALNHVDKSQLAAIWFTTTDDLNAGYPALAARQLGWMNVALMCGHEMAVPEGLPRCIRVLILVNTDKSPEDLQYVYLKDAQGLRSQGLDS